ncbi:SANT/Myb domain [Arabidopsis suecica]|uniref:SANT/Myb domain n=1 Tax=Arabidopsis suecica TaxID=45249 RepID=A0A8T2B4D7_ARASU|nr:SANT/Myb domain [Arabidopsis suecica]
MAWIPPWTRDDDKCFELALVIFPEGSPSFLENIAQLLQKPLGVVKYYYDALVYDVALVESGKYALPKYPDDYNVSLTEATQSKHGETNQITRIIPWTEEEHRFLIFSDLEIALFFLDTMDEIPLWTRVDDKDFELALVRFPEGSPYFLENIAQILQKSLKEVKHYYSALVHDVELIESGNFALPEYRDEDYVSLKEATKSKNQGTGKKKGMAWSPNEHKLFLDGLNKYGKGDWKSISRKCVKTRSPMQVASHAQKYFLRKNKKGKRMSIHDIPLGDVDNVTVPVSSLNSMGQQQPHFGDQMFPDHYYHCSQDNVTNIPGSNLMFMGQQPHFGGQIPPDQCHPYSRDNVTVPESNLKPMGEQSHFGDHIPLDQYDRDFLDNFGFFYDDGSLASFEKLYYKA